MKSEVLKVRNEGTIKLYNNCHDIEIKYYNKSNYTRSVFLWTG